MTTQDEPTEFTAGERAAMKERAKELKAARPGKGRAKVDPEVAVLEKIAEMPEDDRAMAESLSLIHI